MHEPQTAAGDETPPATPSVGRTRRRVLPWVLSAAAVVLLLAGLAALQLTAWQRFDQASTGLRHTLERQDDASRDLQSALTGVNSVRDAATAVLAVPDDGLLPSDARAALSAAGDKAAQQAKAATALLPGAHPHVGAREFWFWDVNAETARLERLDARARASTKSLSDAERPLRASTDALRTAASTAVSTAADRAAAAEGANVPADNEAVLDVRAAVDQVKQRASPFQPRVSGDYAALVQAVQKLEQSHATTLAAESGPLEQSRLDLEAFARSLAPGILMDFEWSDLVNGKGESNGYLSAETSWWYDRGGYATIRLSNSIAQDWPSDSAHAIVAHEVGHAITIRCRTMYDTTDATTAEAWATAWAISMGFTDDANGTSAYGSPPDSLVQTAAGCR
jgi:hypothetical protein